MLAELEGHILIVWIGHRQFDSDFEHVLAEERHPRRPIGLLQIAACRQRRVAIEHADVVEAQEATLEYIPPEAILAIDPPGEIQEQLLEAALEPLLVALALLRLFEAISENCRPRVDGRVHVAEIPLVRR